MIFLRQVGAILAKDLLVEWRAPVRLSGLLFFAFALLLMVAFAANTAEATRRMAGGAIWLGLCLASTRSFDASFAAEFEQGALGGMVVWPVHPVAIYYGKAVANTAVLLAVALVLVPAVIALYGAPVRGDPLALSAFLVLGCAALAAPGTLFALITSQARGASVLLPLLLFPLVVPAMLAASRGTTLILEGDPMEQAGAWLGLLALFDALHWGISGLLFRVALEDA